VFAFAWGATNYKVGDGRPHGPGLLPADAGHSAGHRGRVAVMFKAMVVETEDGDKVGKWAWKPLFFIIVANLLFGVLLGGLPSIGLPAMGLIVAIYGLTFVASWPATSSTSRRCWSWPPSWRCCSYVASSWAAQAAVPGLARPSSRAERKNNTMELINNLSMGFGVAFTPRT
jgi:hypothetical protein